MDIDEKQLIDRAMRTTEQASQIRDLAEQATARFREAEKLIAEAKQYFEDTQKIINEKTICFPWLADALSQYHESADLKLAEFLRKKINPAMSTEEKVRVLAREKREALKKFHLARFRVKYYESLFPWLEDYVQEGLDEIIRQDIDPDKAQEESEDPVDGILKRIPPAEYRRLTVSERNQRALDIWRRSKKTPWQIGRDYERYIGYLHESEGYEVEYHGATEGLEDMGRDLFAAKDGQLSVIQCKYWADHKLIHEKHIFQLYGTVVMLRLQWDKTSEARDSFLFDYSQVSKIKPILITSTKLSPMARLVAQELKVEFQEGKKLEKDYPLIKCNVSGRGGEKIYHLPFDQQYDRVVIEKPKGEFYAKTVAEAEKRGFRRAWKWKGN